MWKVETKVISVITEKNGTISKSLRRYLSNILGKYEIQQLQTNSHIWHYTHTAESANVKAQKHILRAK